MRTEVGAQIRKANTFCYLVDNKHSHLRLGPFKYDVRSVNPFRAIIHEFLTPYEITQMTEHVFPRLSYNESKSLTAYSDSEDASFPDNYKAATVFLAETGDNLSSNINGVICGISNKINTIIIMYNMVVGVIRLLR